MKAVLLPIWPQYCELIANGKKTVEVRKTRPKLETPFKCYIYCTACKSFYSIGCIRYGEDELYRIPNGKIKYGTSVELMCYDDGEYGPDNFLNRKVIGEFVCDNIKCITPVNFVVKEDAERALLGSCLTPKQAKEYAGWKPGTWLSECKDLYSWHISDLVIYDKPKELREFRGLCKYMGRDCCACPYYDYSIMDCKARTIKRPPQSWCYVEIA